MDSPAKTELKFPWLTALVTGAGFAVAAVPGASEALVYSRTAIFHGEVWRIVTGHWVHFSASHYFYDAAALLIAGWFLEVLVPDTSAIGAFYVATPLVIGISLLLFEPSMAIYGGLSGVATAAIVLAVLRGLNHPGWRSVSGIALVFAIARCAIPNSLLSDFSDATIEVSRTSHMAGAAFGIIFHYSKRNSAE